MLLDGAKIATENSLIAEIYVGFRPQVFLNTQQAYLSCRKFTFFNKKLRKERSRFPRVKTPVLASGNIALVSGRICLKNG